MGNNKEHLTLGHTLRIFLRGEPFDNRCRDNIVVTRSEDGAEAPWRSSDIVEDETNWSGGGCKVSRDTH
jgi:hypothetical protein